MATTEAGSIKSIVGFNNEPVGITLAACRMIRMERKHVPKGCLTWDLYTDLLRQRQKQLLMYRMVLIHERRVRAQQAVQEET